MTVSNARKLVSVNAPTVVVRRTVSPPTALDAAATRKRVAVSEEMLASPSTIAPTSTTSIAPARQSSGLGTRLGALLALCGVTSLFAYGAYTLHACARDSFVVPTILSPSSDVVVAARLRLGELHVDRMRALAEMDSVDADLAGAEQALTRLAELKRTTMDALHWTSTVTSQKAHESAAELAALSSQREVLAEMLVAQEQLAEKARKDVDAGVISRADFARQQQALNQVQLALIDNNRATYRGRSALEQSQLAQRALKRRTAPQTPELVSRQEQMIRVDLEMVRLEADTRAKRAQRGALVERIAQIDEMVQQIEERPLYRAADRDLELAFVPYTQLEGVAPGADVLSCLWGLVWCNSVGTVSELVPGEVVQADPWGSPTRGEYIVLDLRDHDAARAKTLRVRSWSGVEPTPPSAPEAAQRGGSMTLEVLPADDAQARIETR